MIVLEQVPEYNNSYYIHVKFYGSADTKNRMTTFELRNGNKVKFYYGNLNFGGKIYFCKNHCYILKIENENIMEVLYDTTSQKDCR